MVVHYHPVLLLLCFVFLLGGGRGVRGEMDMSGYTLVFSQDFTSLSSLSVSPWGPSTWISHTPSNKDWVTFLDPSGPYTPFHLSSPGGGVGGSKGDSGNKIEENKKVKEKEKVLSIRAQRYEKGFGGYAGGMLSSVDKNGKGFTLKYGYFEMEAKLPDVEGTWPAFWLMDALSLSDPSVGSYEIDIFEQYGTSKSLYSSIHNWHNSPSLTWGTGISTLQCTLSTGFHKYGLDLQEDYITFYYDRQQIWKVANNIPTMQNKKFDREMYLMINLAYQVEGPNKAKFNHSDMLVKYIQAWSGSGGSRNSTSTQNANFVSFSPAKFSMSSGEVIQINGARMTIADFGVVLILDNNNNTLWRSPNKMGSDDLCSEKGSCRFVFQSDGNLGLSTPNSSIYWWSNTWENSNGAFVFSNTRPYIQVLDDSCNVRYPSATPIGALPPEPPSEIHKLTSTLTSSRPLYALSPALSPSPISPPTPQNIRFKSTAVSNSRPMLSFLFIFVTLFFLLL